MTPMELAEIEARANAATPGPWEVGVLRRECDHPTTNQFTEERSVFPPLGESGPVALAAEGEHENGAFIAHARTDVPALIAEVKRLRAENDVLRKSADAAVDGVRAMLPAALKVAREEKREACAARLEREADAVHAKREGMDQRAASYIAARVGALRQMARALGASMEPTR